MTGKSGKRLFFLQAGALLAAVLLRAPQQAYAGEPESLSASVELPRTTSAPVAWGRDPFVPAIAGITEPNLRLMAVFYNNVRPSAIINGNIVYVGSAVNGQKIIDIGKTHVILQGDAGSIRLEIAGIVPPEGANDGKKKPQ